MIISSALKFRKFINTLWETNMAMENGPVEDVFPIKNGDFYCHVSLLEGNCFVNTKVDFRPSRCS